MSRKVTYEKKAKEIVDWISESRMPVTALAVRFGLQKYLEEAHDNGVEEATPEHIESHGYIRSEEPEKDEV